MKKIRVGILGGSFNPPHSGHLHISNLAIKRLGLKQLWWIPTIQNPLKNESIKSSYASRIKLCKALTKNNPNIKVKDIERKLFGASKKFYTYNLLKRLKQLYPNYEFYFIIGADSLVSFHKWYNYKKIPELAEIVVISRTGFDKSSNNSKAAKQISYLFLNEQTVDISSTELRNRS